MIKSAIVGLLAWLMAETTHPVATLHLEYKVNVVSASSMDDIYYGAIDRPEGLPAVAMYETSNRTLFVSSAYDPDRDLDSRILLQELILMVEEHLIDSNPRHPVSGMHKERERLFMAWHASRYGASLAAAGNRN